LKSKKNRPQRFPNASPTLQIGELTIHLTDDFKQTYTEMPWTQIKALRNVLAHKYGKIDDESLWETITSDIPKMKDYCFGILKQLDMTIQ